ncbi:transposase-like protein [Hirsutella rhossiliensis]
MDVSRRRLRCIGHVINLVVRAVIFGSNISDDRVFGICRPELAGDDPIFTLEIVVDGKTRWNSIYMMIKRALELRCAIELYQSRWQKPKNDPDHRDLPVTNDFLNAGDWVELERFYEFLKPFYILTKTIEGNASKPGAEGGHGAQALCSSWVLEDESEEVDADNDYSSFGKRSISSLNTQRKKVKAVSELDLFQTRPIYAQDLDVANPLEWWSRHQLEYPVLYRMALDLFSIPGMSAECERVFSQTKKMITDERNQLSPEIVEADQLQKQWLMRGLVA